MGVEGGQDGRIKILRMGRQQSGKYSVIAHGPKEDITAVFNISVLCECSFECSFGVVLLLSRALLLNAVECCAVYY